MELLKRIHLLLAAEGTSAELKEGEEITTFIATGALGSRLKIAHHGNYLKVLVLIPIFAPEYRRAAMAEAITRANWGLQAGCFEMDWSDGELRLRSSMPVLDGNLTDEQIKCLIFTAWGVAKQYAQALMEVSVSEVSPELAITRAEASWREEHRNSKLTVH